MHGLAARAIRNLVPAAGAIGHQHGVGPSRTHRRQQIKLGHLLRDGFMARLKTETAGHAATARADRLDLQTRDFSQQDKRRRECVKRLLMAMTVHQGMGLRQGLQLEIQAPGT